MSKDTPNYFTHNARKTNDVPLEVVEWREPVTLWRNNADPSIEVEERDLTEAEWTRFKKILAGLE